MKTILNDIRLLSKLENGQIEFEYSAFDLKVLLERLYRTQVGCYEPNLAGKEAPGGSDEEVDVGRDVKFYMVLNGLDSLSGGGGEDQWTLLNPTKEYFPKKLKGDATRLLVILNHTISNAFENTEHGSVTLRVCVERVRDLNQRDVDGEIVTPGGRKAVKNGEGGKKQVLVTFEVEDTGKELTSEEMQRLFKGYSQGSAGMYNCILFTLSSKTNLMEFFYHSSNNNPRNPLPQHNLLPPLTHGQRNACNIFSPRYQNLVFPLVRHDPRRLPQRRFPKCGIEGTWLG